LDHAADRAMTLCSLIEGRPVWGGVIACNGGLSSWPEALAIAVFGAAMVVAIQRGASSRAFCGAVLMTLAALALAFAAAEPVRITTDDTARAPGHVVAVIDSSDSVWRTEGAARTTIDRLADRAADMAQALAGEDWTAEVLTFADGVRPVGATIPLGRLDAAIRSLPPVTGGDGSRGGAALDAALDRIVEMGGRGAILLLSDGNFRPAMPDEAVERAASMGVPISTLAVGSPGPSLGLVAVDLGPEQRIGQEAIVRASVLGAGRIIASDGDARTEDIIGASDRLRPVRASTRFSRRGIQYVQLAFHGDDGFVQERSLFTLVKGPAQLLVFGHAPWLDRLDPSRFMVVRGNPDAPQDPAQFDLVVLDGMAPSDLAPGYDADLLAAAERTGIMLVNGPLRGVADDPQVIGDWNDSDLSPILPVDSDPRLFVQDPPGRDIAILIDTSGSMQGSFGLAQDVAETIIAQLRPQDTLAILPFSDRTGARFERTAVTPDAVRRAERFIAGLSVGGGTAPESTLRAAAALRSNYCAFFFISDGGFTLPPTRPQCFTTAVSTVGQPFPRGVAAWGQEILLRGGLGDIELEYFEPEVRDLYWRAERFTPIATEDTAPLTARSIPGVAIAYPRTDADVLSVHPNAPPDPVLAIRRDRTRPGAGVAVFLSDIPPTAPAAEIEDILTSLLAWSDPDRFDLRVRQTGDRLQVTVVAVASDAGTAAIPTSLSGVLRLSDERTRSLSFRADGPQGRFVAETTLGDDVIGRGTLVLSEPGRASQVIPISFPETTPRASGTSSDERFDFGINLAELGDIAGRTGGVDLTEALPVITMVAARVERSPLHPYAIALALGLLAAALWSGKRVA
jgi:hypothetical protein